MTQPSLVTCSPNVVISRRELNNKNSSLSDNMNETLATL